jgi:arginase family enzyme
MVISQVIGRGAPELVRFWGEPPLVREPDVALFGFERLDAPEEQYLVASPLRRHASLEVSTIGAAAAARLALERVHAAKHEFILHFDVDVINGEDYPWTNFPGAGGLGLNEVRDALRVFVSQPNLAAFVVAGYNPDLDADGQGARKLIDLLADVLSTRLETTTAAAGVAADPAPASSVSGASSSETSPAASPSAAGSVAESDRTTPSDLPEEAEPDAATS